ncbi:24958_t:CDS:1, partial [Gigaspora rosea]
STGTQALLIIKGLRFLALPCSRACNLMPKPGPSSTTFRVPVDSPGPCG